MIKLKQILVLFLIVMPTLAFSQKALPDAEKGAVIEKIKKIIDVNYVFEDKVKSVNQALDKLIQSGKYEEITKYEDFADALSEDLVEITQDKHFKIQYNPGLVKSRRARRARINQEQENEEEENDGEEEEVIDWNLWYARKENFGFEKVEILDGNIGYVKFNFWQPLAWAKPTIDASMTFVSNTDALIIDLRENQGGYSPTDSYLGTYFFDGEPFEWMASYNRPSRETTRDSTFQEVGGARYLNKPIYILISEQTFSMAELFAYAMKHFGKAIIIGQPSAGAAHAIDFLEIDDNYLIQVPISYNIHPVTKTDWEGKGVIPDISTKQEEALKTAHLKALDKQIDFAKKAGYESILKRYQAIKKKLTQE